MSYEVVLERRALQALQRLPSPADARIERAARAFMDDPAPWVA